MHGLGSGISLLERGWTLLQFGVALCERQQAGVEILVSPQMADSILGFFMPMDAASLYLQVEDQFLTVISTYVPKDS